MSDEKPVRRSEFAASLNGIPSAMDEVQFRRVIRDFGNIEAKGLQIRAQASEVARVTAHLREIYVHNAIDASQMRDYAAKNLTADEYSNFDRILSEVEAEFHRTNLNNIREGFDQGTQNIRDQPIETARQNKRDDRYEGFKKALRLVGFVDVEEKGEKK